MNILRDQLHLLDSVSFVVVSASCFLLEGRVTHRCYTFWNELWTHNFGIGYVALFGVGWGVACKSVVVGSVYQPPRGEIAAMRAWASWPVWIALILTRCCLLHLSSNNSHGMDFNLFSENCITIPT